jgi:hypothetical protein
MDAIFNPVVSVVLSVIVSTAVAWWLGPKQVMRHERAHRELELRRRMSQPIIEFIRHLHEQEKQIEALARGNQATLRWTIRDYERLLWPVVKDLDDLDLPRKLSDKIGALLRDILGSWRLNYLSICVTPDLENALDRYPIQPRDLEEPASLLEVMCGRPLREAEPVRAALAKSENILELLR